MLLDAGHGSSCGAFLLVLHLTGLCVDNTFHARLIISIAVFFVTAITAHGRSSTSATPGAFIVASKSVTSCKASAALGTDVRPLTSVEFSVSLQVMQTAKPRLTGLTHVRLFLAVCK